MELKICNDLNDWVYNCDHWLKQNVMDQVALSKVYLPAGSTPIPLYKFWQTERPDYLSKCSFIQLDEVIGSNPPMFQTFFKENLPDFSHSIRTPEKSFIQADFAILGLGLNGHLGFHEPSVGINFNHACVKLEDVTVKNLNLPKNSWGVTYGLEAFLNCKEVLLMVRGESKSEILKNIFNNSVQSPATELISKHKKLTIVLDQLVGKYFL